ncbi:McrC family protein [Arthrobacter sulfonylureivorans]|uniref:McrC family protein n=1 Tax=Arthrobacter sulfonylureivorans TaxID=2486855 RepID=A0ABY3WD75_9MICC|nr:McrC family protein [Arthrobacter sulfonylureivorans]
MLAVPRLQEGVRRRLQHLDRKLDGAAMLNRGDRLPAWTPSRSNAGYVSALRISEIILQNAVAEAAPGPMHVASFTVNMAKVFEDFVTVALAEALRKHPGQTKAQYKVYLDEPWTDDDSRIMMRPDVVHVINSQPVLIFDAKYKAASSRGQYPNADHYQMLAYCTALRRDQAWLLYADFKTGRTRRVRNSGVSICEASLSLAESPECILGGIRRTVTLAYEQWEHADGASGSDGSLKLLELDATLEAGSHQTGEADH